MSKRKKLKYLFRLCVAYVLLAPFLMRYRELIPLEFSDRLFASTYWDILLLTIPHAVVIAGICDYMLNSQTRHRSTQLVTVAVLSGITCFFGFMMMMIGGGDYVDDQRLFVNQDQSESIIVRLEPFSHAQEIVKVKSLGSNFNLVTRVDTTLLDRSLWLPVAPENRQIAW